MSANPSKPYSPRGQGAKNRMSATPPALIPAVRGGAHPILGHGRSERQSMPEGCRSSQTSPIHGMPTNARHAPKHRQTLSSPKHTILFLSTRCLGLGLPGSTLGAVLSELYSATTAWQHNSATTASHASAATGAPRCLTNHHATCLSPAARRAT